MNKIWRKNKMMGCSENLKDKAWKSRWREKRKENVVSVKSYFTNLHAMPSEEESADSKNINELRFWPP